MSNLEDVVEEVIEGMVRDAVLFTALDVSNKVKESLPLTRHREVRDLVRGMFDSHIEPLSYAKTPIQVTLDDGSMVEAILYHPLADSWDLDTKYDTQKRAQKAARPGQNNPVVPSSPVAATIASDGTLTVNTPVVSVAASTVASAPVTNPNARALWDQMFQSQPSLFPRK